MKKLINIQIDVVKCITHEAYILFSTVLWRHLMDGVRHLVGGTSRKVGVYVIGKEAPHMGGFVIWGKGTSPKVEAGTSFGGLRF